MYSIVCPKEIKIPKMNDYESIKKDWEKVGKDFRIVIKKLSLENKSKE